MRTATCLHCGKELKELYPGMAGTSPFWEGATVDIDAGFGSRFDLDNFTGVICDDCIESLLSKEAIKAQ